MESKAMKVVEFIRYTVSLIEYWKGKYKSGSICLSGCAILKTQGVNS